MTEQEIQSVMSRLKAEALRMKRWRKKHKCKECVLHPNCTASSIFGASPNVWEIEPEVTDDDKAILRNIAKEYKWITRDRDGDVAVFSDKPIRSNSLGKWGRNSEDDLGIDLIKQCAFPNLFAGLQWEDEPWYIPDLIG